MRSDLDNMQKSRIRRSYPLTFSVELLFEPWAENSQSAFYTNGFELVD